jgi:hypothetical protein
MNSIKELINHGLIHCFFGRFSLEEAITNATIVEETKKTPKAGYTTGIHYS